MSENTTSVSETKTSTFQKVKDFVITNKFYVIAGVITIGLAVGIYYYSRTPDSIPPVTNPGTTQTVEDCTTEDLAIVALDNSIKQLNISINTSKNTKANLETDILKVEGDIKESEADLAEAKRELGEATDDLSDAKKSLVGVSSGFGVFGALVIVVGGIYLYRKRKAKKDE
ncbi:hypothetical protein EPVG_00036 [Emiliania huxleyi virus 201]|nr:hypothetical protein ELVG_00205 [Emiliania huxleyi virus 203]AEP15582.1 hypothetical protein EQVG_00172 [Emiliania huxleyi virus 207]AEP16032.1 hypothetical protein ERVG_00155 [Emiliania huxleyi virus 208]AET97924.1 hypothetical protein EPVG_00036 [Emiliania huxleyi virus 201]